MEPADIAPENPQKLAEWTSRAAAKDLGVDSGRWVRGVSFESLGKDELGKYDPWSGRILLNRDLASSGRSRDLQWAVAHETFHAYQAQKVDVLQKAAAHEAAATESGSAKKDGAVANERLPYDAHAADWESDIHPYGPGPVCTGTGEHAYERDAVAYADKFIRSLPG